MESTDSKRADMVVAALTLGVIDNATIDGVVIVGCASQLNCDCNGPTVAVAVNVFRETTIAE